MLMRSIGHHAAQGFAWLEAYCIKLSIEKLLLSKGSSKTITFYFVKPLKIHPPIHECERARYACSTQKILQTLMLPK